MTRPYHKWSKEHLDYLQTHYQNTPIGDMATHLQRSYDSVASRLEVLGLVKGYNLIDIDGQSLTLGQLAKKYNIAYHTLFSRINTYGMDLKTALTKPLRGKG